MVREANEAAAQRHAVEDAAKAKRKQQYEARKANKKQKQTDEK